MQTTETIKIVKVETGIASGFQSLYLLLPGHTRIKIKNPSVIETLNDIFVVIFDYVSEHFDSRMHERKYSLTRNLVRKLFYRFDIKSLKRSKTSSFHS